MDDHGVSETNQGIKRTSICADVNCLSPSISGFGRIPFLTGYADLKSGFGRGTSQALRLAWGASQFPFGGVPGHRWRSGPHQSTSLIENGWWIRNSLAEGFDPSSDQHQHVKWSSHQGSYHEVPQEFVALVPKVLTHGEGEIGTRTRTMYVESIVIQSRVAGLHEYGYNNHQEISSMYIPKLPVLTTAHVHPTGPEASEHKLQWTRPPSEDTGRWYSNQCRTNADL